MSHDTQLLCNVDDSLQTILDKIATLGQIHPPELQDKYGLTVAMYITIKENSWDPSNVPPEWRHDPALGDNFGRTVAMWLSSRGRPVPPEWIHDPLLKDKQDQTVAYWYQFHDLQVPQIWQDMFHEIELQNETCCICLGNETQYVRTRCQHTEHICTKCIIYISKCPLCNKEDFLI